MSLSQELAKGRSTDQLGLQIEDFAGGCDLRMTSAEGRFSPLGSGQQADVGIRFREEDVLNGRDESVFASEPKFHASVFIRRRPSTNGVIAAVS